GTLWPNDYLLDDGTEPAPLEVIRVGVQTSRPAPHQPENWVIDGSRWELLERPAGKGSSSILQSAIVRGPELLMGFSDRIDDAEIHRGLKSSLALIAPRTLSLYHQLSYRGNPQARGRFALGTVGQPVTYDLSITDLAWRNRVLQQGPHTLSQNSTPFIMT